MATRRGIAIVVSLIAAAVLVSMAGLLVMYLLVAREPTIARDSTLVLRVRGDLAEVEPRGLVGQLLPTPPTVRSIVENLRKAKVDRRVTGVIMAPAGTTALWGKVQEIRDAVLDFKESGKPIVAYLEHGGDREYYLATACDRVFLLPASWLDLTGLASYEMFLRGTLDKLGIFPDLLHVGEYKTAANNLTEQSFTPEHREMTESLNRDLYEQLIRGVAEARNLSVADVVALVDEGPFLAREALERGLVDDLAYEDEVDDRLRRTGVNVRRIEHEEYRRVSPQALGLGRGPRIAVIYAVGIIATGRSRHDSPQGPIVGSDTIAEYLRLARDDEGIRAIVLRIDSPGGSVIASDAIWRAVQLARDEKPLVASMSDLGASGGYYIAMPAHAIVAQPGTLTGSIGVLGGKFVTEGMFDKVGLNVETVSEGRFAEMNSPVRPYTPEERARILAQMQAVYDVFVEKAAHGRDTTPEAIDEVARGRVWTGRQAREVGLIDDLGGLRRALEIARERAGLDPDEEVELVIYPPRRTVFELLADPFSAPSGALAALLRAEERRALGTLTAPLHLFRRGEPLALMPYVFLR